MIPRPGPKSGPDRLTFRTRDIPYYGKESYLVDTRVRWKSTRRRLWNRSPTSDIWGPWVGWTEDDWTFRPPSESSVSGTRVDIATHGVTKHRGHSLLLLMGRLNPCLIPRRDSSGWTWGPGGVWDTTGDSGRVVGRGLLFYRAELTPGPVDPIGT